MSDIEKEFKNRGRILDTCEGNEVLFMLVDYQEEFVHILVAEIANLIIPESVRKVGSKLVLDPVLTDPSRTNECKRLVYYVAEEILRKVLYDVKAKCLIVTNVPYGEGVQTRGFFSYYLFPNIRSRETVHNFVRWIESWYGDLTEFIKAIGSHFVSNKLVGAGSVRIHPDSLRRRFGYTPKEIESIHKLYR
jgi:hypothetical protein